MKRYLTSLLIAMGMVWSFAGQAQDDDFGFRLGAAWYLGDLSGTGPTTKFGPLNIQFSQAGIHLGGNYRHFFSPSIAIQTELNWARVKGTDKLSERPTQYSRNLSFRNDIVDVSAMVQWHFFRLEDVGRTYRYKLSFSPYLTAGLSLFYSNPKAEYQGSYVALRPLQTEGFSYSAIGLAVPFGVGFEFRVDKQHIIGLEFTARRTFTDYLDDVSTNYKHYTTFTDPVALALQDRSVELEGTGDPLFIGSAYYSYSSNPDNVAIRGNSQFKDWYMWTGVYYKYALRSKKKRFNRRKYHFARRKVKRRRSRAKF